MVPSTLFPFKVSIKIFICSTSKSSGTVMSTFMVSGNLTETQEYIEREARATKNIFFMF